MTWHLRAALIKVKMNNKNMTIITEQDIINTYNERQQKQCELYYNYKKIKQDNPSFGYKRIAKLLGQPYHKTRWWHAKKYIPVPIQTVNWLKERNLLPLNINHTNIKKISKILGSTFGDGGIFENLNGIFLSSSEISAVSKFSNDLREIFGEDIHDNSRVIEGGEYGHSWCYQNTNRKIIRFFKALGTPCGKKTKIIVKIPSWISQNSKVEDLFYGSLFGSDIGIPKVHKLQNKLNTLEFGTVSHKENDSNKLNYLKQIKEYLKKRGIKTTKIKVSFDKKKNHYVYRLQLSTTYGNVHLFKEKVKLHYCRYKSLKLKKTLEEFRKLKSKRYDQLLERGYKEHTALNLLNLTARDLYIIKNPLDKLVP